MSTLSVATIKSQSSSPPTIQNTSGTEVGTFCRAWVNFNGTGTVAIRASFNVSSITDNGTGDYTVNFTNALVDANSSVVVTCQRMDSTGFESVFSGIRTNTSSNISSSSTRVYTAYSTTTPFDAGQVCVAIFR